MVRFVDADLAKLYKELGQALAAAKSKRELHRLIVEAPFVHNVAMALLFLGFITFFLVNDEEHNIAIAAVTDNDYYHMSVQGYAFDPSQYKLHLDDASNSIAQAIRKGKPVSTGNWDSLRRPEVSDGVARLNQANSGINYSSVYPLQGKVKGALLYNFFQYDGISKHQHAFMRKYTKLVSGALG